MSTVQFGVNVSTSAAAHADPVRDARRAEELGFDFVSASDHPCGDETWTMLTWIAASTSRIGIATRVSRGRLDPVTRLCPDGRGHRDAYPRTGRALDAGRALAAKVLPART